jgi:hypothetical protein
MNGLSLPHMIWNLGIQGAWGGTSHLQERKCRSVKLQVKSSPYYRSSTRRIDPVNHPNTAESPELSAKDETVVRRYFPSMGKETVFEDRYIESQNKTEKPYTNIIPVCRLYSAILRGKVAYFLTTFGFWRYWMWKGHVRALFLVQYNVAVS